MPPGGPKRIIKLTNKELERKHEAAKKGAKTNRERIGELSAQVKEFISALVISPRWDVTEAAKQAGYSKPGEYGAKLLKDPRVQQAIADVLKRREERCQLKQDDVLEYLRFALFFNPLTLFKVGRDGKWVIKDPSAIPDEVGRMIEECKRKEMTMPDGTVIEIFEIRLLSKSLVLGYALKHLGLTPDKVRNVVDATVKVNWDDLYQQPTDQSTAESIERQIISVEALPDKPPMPADKPQAITHQTAPSSNGTKGANGNGYI